MYALNVSSPFSLQIFIQLFKSSSCGSSVLKINCTYCFLTSIAKLIKIQLVDLIFLSFYELKQESRRFYVDA